MSPNVPIQLLIEAQQHVVTVELTSGELYRGRLLASEDNMNVKMSDVVVTARDGKVTHMDLVYVRGSHVKLFILPDILRYSPILRPETLDTEIMEKLKKQRLRVDVSEYEINWRCSVADS